jgi:hypothetical protein
VSLQYWPLGIADSPSYAAPLAPLASFPPASTVEGQILRPAELPHVELIALGGVWRPRGGRQLLQPGVLNPVTVPGTTTTLAETLGPFPGGLVRAGMQLELEAWIEHNGISSSTRFAFWRTPGNIDISQINVGYNGTDLNTTLIGQLDVLSDTTGLHRSARQIGEAYLQAGQSRSDIALDFSQSWTTSLWLQSVNENTTNITSVSWSGGVATFVNPSHTLNTGDKTTVAGVSNTAYNGVYSNITRVDANTWSGTLVADPSGAGTGGTSSRVSNMRVMRYLLWLMG